MKKEEVAYDTSFEEPISGGNKKEKEQLGLVDFRMVITGKTRLRCTDREIKIRELEKILGDMYEEYYIGRYLKKYMQ